MKQAVAVQTQKLVEYAEKESFEMVKYVAGMYHDDTFNLQDSLVWCVYYNGQQQASGFPVPALANKTGYLHAWSKSMKEPVNGRELAQVFASSYKPSTTKGWEVVWAAAAPYAGYGESGFTLHGRVIHFKVISQRYDAIRQALGSKCKVLFKVYVPKY